MSHEEIRGQLQGQIPASSVGATLKVQRGCRKTHQETGGDLQLQLRHVKSLEVVITILTSGKKMN